MTYVIIGASGGLGRALADRLAADGKPLILVGRNANALEALAGALRDRHGIEAQCIAADVAQDTTYLERIRDTLHGEGITGLLMPIGHALRDGLETGSDTAGELAGVNFLAPAQAANALWPELMAGGGTVVGFGSITAARGRKRKVVAGAMQRALHSDFDRLRLAARGTPVKVQFWVLGFLDSDAMKTERTPLPKADPARLADKVVGRLGHDIGVIYFPWWWRPLTLALRLMPWALYARLAGRG